MSVTSEEKKADGLVMRAAGLLVSGSFCVFFTLGVVRNALALLAGRNLAPHRAELFTSSPILLWLWGAFTVLGLWLIVRCCWKEFAALSAGRVRVARSWLVWLSGLLISLILLGIVMSRPWLHLPTAGLLFVVLIVFLWKRSGLFAPQRRPA